MVNLSASLFLGLFGYASAIYNLQLNYYYFGTLSFIVLVGYSIVKLRSVYAGYAKNHEVRRYHKIKKSSDQFYGFAIHLCCTFSVIMLNDVFTSSGQIKFLNSTLIIDKDLIKHYFIKYHFIIDKDLIKYYFALSFFSTSMVALQIHHLTFLWGREVKFGKVNRDDDSKVKEKDFTKIKLPMMTVAINTGCNQTCVYCPPMGESHMCAPSNLDHSLANRVVERALEYGVKVFRFTGGEALLHPNINKYFDIMRKLKKKGVRVYLNTNGVKLIGNIDKINNQCLDGLRVSLDTLDPIKYEQITGTNSLESVLRGLRAAREKGIKIEILMLVIRHNIQDVPSLMEYCSSNGMDLKLLDVEQHDFDDQEFWRHQFVPLSELTPMLSKNAIRIRKSKKKGEWGIDMTEYQYPGGLKVKVKDSTDSAVYNDICKSECTRFPCPEGIFSVILKPEGSLTWCRRLTSTSRKLELKNSVFNFRGGADCVDASFDGIINDLRGSSRVHHDDKAMSFQKSETALLPLKKILSGELAQENQRKAWEYVGCQKVHGRDNELK